MLRLRAAVRRSSPHLVIPVLLAPFLLAPFLLAPFGSALAQTAPAPAPAAPPTATAAPAPADPVVAKVNGQPIYLSDLQAAAQGLPDNLRAMPPQMLFPMLLDQLIDGRALVAEAEKTGVDKDPAVARQMQAASDRALQSAMLSKDVGPGVTDAAVKARFDKEAAGKPPEQEIHASHILVANEADAKKIIAALNGGADFATLAKQDSTDPSGKTGGGDLGWFKKDDMVPEFSAAAFALKPGEITQTPVHTQFGWHVIKLEEVRTANPPTFEQAREDLRQKMIQEGVQQAVTQAKIGLTIQKFNMDGTPMKATDGAEPPPAAKP